MNVCVISDNKYIFEEFKKIALSECSEHSFTYFFSESNVPFMEEFASSESFRPLNIQKVKPSFFDNWELVISLHCRQVFPRWLTDKKRCINIHPGYNPYNRGWYPHIFCICNGLPAGVAIHEMDSKLDHGMIIFREQIQVESYDTGKTFYDKIMEKEVQMLRKKLPDIISGNYKLFPPEDEGNINYKKDFYDMCELDLDSVGTLREHLSLLRALTFPGYKNAYYIEDGKKVYISLDVETSQEPC